MKKFWIKKGLMFFTFFVAAILLFGAVVMGLWNNVLAQVIAVKTVTYGQALGILLLSKILFGGFGGRGRGGCGPRGQWGANMKAKWENMSPEERANFKEEWRNKCSRWGRRREDAPTAE